MKALSNTIAMAKRSKSRKDVGRGSSTDGQINTRDEPNFLNEIFFWEHVIEAYKVLHSLHYEIQL